MSLEDFDPLTSRVIRRAIFDFRSIERRARALLASKSLSDIREAQWQIEEFRRVTFEAELESAVGEEKARLRDRALYEGDEDAARFFEIIIDGKGERHCTFREGMQEEFEDMPHLDDRGRLESVLELIEVGLPLDLASLEDWTASDFLAAHSLALAEEAGRELMRVAEPCAEDLEIQAHADDLAGAVDAYRGALKLTRLDRPRFIETVVRNAFNLALEAMDSVGKAEFQAADSASQALRRQLARQVSSAEEEAKTERDKRRHAALAAVNLRHARTHEIREEVLREWDADRSRFPSAERAGDYFAAWLEDRGFSYQQRTVRDWIRAHAKAKGVLLR